MTTSSNYNYPMPQFLIECKKKYLFCELKWVERSLIWCLMMAAFLFVALSLLCGLQTKLSFCTAIKMLRQTNKLINNKILMRKITMMWYWNVSSAFYCCIILWIGLSMTNVKIVLWVFCMWLILNHFMDLQNNLINLLITIY